MMKNLPRFLLSTIYTLFTPFITLDGVARSPRAPVPRPKVNTQLFILLSYFNLAVLLSRCSLDVLCPVFTFVHSLRLVTFPSFAIVRPLTMHRALYIK
jgi:hypothetical protein